STATRSGERRQPAAHNVPGLAGPRCRCWAIASTRCRTLSPASDSLRAAHALCPDCVEYQLYFAQQPLSGRRLYQQAMKVSASSSMASADEWRRQIEEPAYRSQMLKLEAAIKYDEEDFTGARALVDQCQGLDDPDRPGEPRLPAVQGGNTRRPAPSSPKAMQVDQLPPDLAYNMAVCITNCPPGSAAGLKLSSADIHREGHPRASGARRWYGNEGIERDRPGVEAFKPEGGHRVPNTAQLRAPEAQDALTRMLRALSRSWTPVSDCTNLGLLLATCCWRLYVKTDFHDLAAEVLGARATGGRPSSCCPEPYLMDFLEAVIPGAITSACRSL
uniref:Tetratricopeptide repeat protein 30 n=1 Tax=Macrostomum lignano TaxID=282301 RepID=A0A1I8JM92_9PLAT